MRRFLALAAAYAIVLSGVIASFAAAQAAAAVAANSGIVICHTESDGQPAPSDNNGNTCIDNCCNGCLMLMAALPPPPLNVMGAPQSAGRTPQPLARAELTGRPDAESHRSRAPPPTA